MAEAGLRERKKAQRRELIMDIARRKFRDEPYGDVTIESLAYEAGISGVTVYNYFGHKAGLLLALVEEGDRKLTRQLIEEQAQLTQDAPNFLGYCADFAQRLRLHATGNLPKPVWREILAASIQSGSEEFGRSYQALDRALTDFLAHWARVCLKAGTLPAGVDPDALADTVFLLQNARFQQFMSDDSLTDAEIDTLMRRDFDQFGRLFA
ncbi:TetR/AcrR family transcriptional regulator [Rhizobium sp. SGZ-381]|uniref:TetR/AcrR family transcriptional regulator n=1 Tax=Rhizobium sp. SGZ-381 TaxID=3342800 RepID=UPI00366A5B3F